MSLDHVWALALLIVGFDLLYRKRAIPAGVCLGLAAGFRLTSLCFLPPFIIARQRPGEAVKRLTQLGLGSLIVSGLCFGPVAWRYGVGALTFYDPPYPSPSLVGYGTSVAVWGVAGTFGLAAAVVPPESS